MELIVNPIFVVRLLKWNTEMSAPYIFTKYSFAYNSSTKCSCASKLGPDVKFLTLYTSINILESKSVLNASEFLL